MKKTLAFILALLLLGSWFYISNDTPRSLSNTDLSPTVPSKQTQTVTEDKTAVLPHTFTIPKLGIHTTIEAVGLDSEKKMDVPKNADNVAWYNLGHAIGSNGSAVIAGHYDKGTGAPAVFYDLSKLSSGDKIEVTMNNGKRYTYLVTKIQTYPHDAVPLEEVFNTTDKGMLNLITCEGVFNSNTNLYSKRLVVYSELSN